MGDARREWVATADVILSPIPGLYMDHWRCMVAGDTLRIDGPVEDVAMASWFIEIMYPVLAPKDGEEARAWSRHQEVLAAADKAGRDWRDERARRWMDEHGGIPDYVVDFLRA